MHTNQNSEAWFAVQVKTRRERSIAALLEMKGYQTLLPTYESQRSGGGRVRSVEAPLFPGYVFCQFDVLKRLPILVTPGVISLVGTGRVPIPVEPSEIAALEALVSAGVPAQPWPYLEVGNRVRIEDRSMQGIEGILLGFKGRQRIIISVTLLRRSVALEIDRASISPIRATGKAQRSLARPVLEGATA